MGLKVHNIAIAGHCRHESESERKLTRTSSSAASAATAAAGRRRCWHRGTPPWRTRPISGLSAFKPACSKAGKRDEAQGATGLPASTPAQAALIEAKRGVEGWKGAEGRLGRRRGQGVEAGPWEAAPAPSDSASLQEMPHKSWPAQSVGQKNSMQGAMSRGLKKSRLPSFNAKFVN